MSETFDKIFGPGGELTRVKLRLKKCRDGVGHVVRILDDGGEARRPACQAPTEPIADAEPADPVCHECIEIMAAELRGDTLGLIAAEAREASAANETALLEKAQKSAEAREASAVREAILEQARKYLAREKERTLPRWFGGRSKKGKI